VKRAALIAGLCLPLAGCPGGFVKPEDPIVARIDALEQRLAQVERVVNNQSLLEMSQRIDELRGELDALRGELERVDHEAAGSGERSKQLFVDLDGRLRAIEEGGARAPAPQGAGAGDQADYDAAFGLLKESRYDQARAGFEGFLKQYADSPLRDNAQFWLGETYYVTRQFKPALAEFERLVKSYPDSNKLADGWLRIGYCQYELGQFAAARKALEAVVARFPGEEAAKSAAARLKKMDKEKR
jgi:tol-pal system protein YbgF